MLLNLCNELTTLSNIHALQLQPLQQSFAGVVVVHQERLNSFVFISIERDIASLSSYGDIGDARRFELNE